LRCCFETIRGRADAKYPQRPRINERMIELMPTGPDPSTSTVSPIAISARSTACNAVGSAQPPANKRFRLGVESDTARARLEINLLGPAAAKAIIQPVGDSINPAVWTARCCFGNQTVPAGIAGSVHIEKGDAITFPKRPAFDINQRPVNLAQAAGGDVARNKWIGDALQESSLKINIGATDFRQFDLEQGRVLFEHGFRNFTEFYRRVWLRDYGDQRHQVEGKRKKAKREVQRGLLNFLCTNSIPQPGSGLF